MTSTRGIFLVGGGNSSTVASASLNKSSLRKLYSRYNIIDAQTATVAHSPALPVNIVWNGVNFISGYSSGDSRVQYSADGLTWTQSSNSLTNSNNSFVVNTTNNVIMCAVNDSTNIPFNISTDNGVSWSKPTGTLTHTLSQSLGYIHSLNRWISVPNTIDTTCHYSDDDGASWTVGGVLPFSPSFFWNQPVEIDNQVLVNSGYQTNYAYSIDGGVSWVSRSGSLGSSLKYLSYFNWVIDNDPNQGGTNSFSKNGTSWEAITNSNNTPIRISSMDQPISDILNPIPFIIGNSGASTDYSIWTKDLSQFCKLCNNGVRITRPFNFAYSAIAYNGTRYVLIQSNNFITFTGIELENYYIDE